MRDVGVIEISEAMKINKTLTELDLEGCLFALKACFKHLPNRGNE